MHQVFWIGLVLTATSPTQMSPSTSPASRPIARLTSPTAIVKALGGEYKHCVEALGGGRIDWTRGEILARGVGKARSSSAKALAQARRAARLEAARNAILLISGVRVDANGRYPDIERADLSIKGVLRNFEETSVEYDPRGRTVTLTLRVPLYGANGVVRMSGIPTHRRAGKWFAPRGEGVAEGVELVLIDARKTRFKPVMFPRLETPKGARVFDCSDVPRDQLLRGCPVVYTTKVRIAKLVQGPPRKKPLPRVLRLHASRSKGKSHGTLVLSDEELDKLSAHPEAQQLFKTGKLVIVAN